MVFCRECRKRVADCEHFVPALQAKPVEVFDPKVQTLAYEEKRQILEIAFKNGQTWQLRPVPLMMYETILDQNISSFLKFVGHRYHAHPVRKAITIPESEPCPACKRGMTKNHQTTGNPVRVLWHCAACNQTLWHTYATDSVRERKGRWH